MLPSRRPASTSSWTTHRGPSRGQDPAAWRPPQPPRQRGVPLSMRGHQAHRARLDLRIDLLRHAAHPSNSERCGIKPGALHYAHLPSSPALSCQGIRDHAGIRSTTPPTRWPRPPRARDRGQGAAALGVRPARRRGGARPVQSDLRRRAGEAATVADHLEGARGDILAFTAFLKEISRQI